MPIPIINWKGSPHRYLPQIRAAAEFPPSTNDTATLAAEDVVRTPLGLSLQKVRRKYQFKVTLQGRKRRSRASSTIATLRARRRASQRFGQTANQNLQIFGWSSQVSQSDLQVPSKPSKPERSHSKTLPLPVNEAESSILSVDGAGHSVEGPYSLMQTSDVPNYWGRYPNHKGDNPIWGTTPGYQPTKEYAHVGALEVVSQGKKSRKSKTASGLRAHNRNSIDRKQRGNRSIKLPAIPQSTLDVSKDKPASETSKPRNTPSIKSVVQTIVSDLSRTPSQKKALNRFAKGLETYLEAYQAQPTGPLLRTPSTTTISAYTIEALKPYHAELSAAGLAVSSGEQKRIEKFSKAPAPPSTPIKETRFQDPVSKSVKANSGTSKAATSTMGIRGGKRIDKAKPKLPSVASGSTGTTVLGFTPPHEKSYPRSSPHRRLSSASDHTIVGFTPPHERTKTPPSASKAPTKKILPWLRKRETPPESPRSPTKRSVASRPYVPRPTTPLRGWVAHTHEGELFVEQDKPVEQGRPKAPSAKGGLYTPSHPPGSYNIPKSPSSSGPSVRAEGKAKAVYTQSYVPNVPNETSTRRNFEAEDNSAEDIARRRTLPMFSRHAQRSRDANYPKRKTEKTIKADQATQTERARQGRLMPTAPAITLGITTAEASPIITKTDLYINEVETRKELADRTAIENNMPSAPLRERTSPRLCTWCANNVDDTFPASNAQQFPHIDPTTGRVIGCTCGTKSCLNCQQCFPSRRETYEGILTEPPVQVQALPDPFQTSDRPVLPAGTVIYTDPFKPTPIKEVLEDTIRSLPIEERLKHSKAIEEMISEYSRKYPIADPPKRQSIPRSHIPITSPQQQPQSHNPNLSPPPTQSLPQDPPRPSRPPPLPRPTTISILNTSILDPDNIRNSQIFKGLQVATAAACDRNVDKWLEEVTGLSPRRFLADLNKFEDLGVNALKDVAKRAERERKDKLVFWEAMRRQRLRERGVGGAEEI